MQKINYIRSLKVSLRENSSPYGYSVLITGVFSMLAIIEKETKPFSIFLATGGALLAFVSIEVFVIYFFKNIKAKHLENTKTIARLFYFIAVGLGVLAAYLSALMFQDYLAWFLGGLTSTAVFILSDSLGLSIVARRGITERIKSRFW